MFTIKATYRGQTRKYTFHGINSFPGYDELSAQVCLYLHYKQPCFTYCLNFKIHRLFPIPLGFYLSGLLFGPDASSPAHILVSKEVRSAQDYSQSISPFRDRKWRHAVLKFTIYDIGSAPAPSWPFGEQILRLQVVVNITDYDFMQAVPRWPVWRIPCQ